MPKKEAKIREEYRICLKGEKLIPVSREVYLCWYGGKRKERYQKEQDKKHGMISLESMGERVFTDGKDGENTLISKENVADSVIQDLMIQRLTKEIELLQKEKRQLIEALYFENLSVCAYAKQIGVTNKTVYKRRNKILEALKEKME